ncbi:MAG: deoxyribose-phosphate aldolase [Planctomycetota bacterium]
MNDSLVALIDHAVLQPTQTADDLRSACELCVRVGVASVCVKPCFVQLASELLDGSSVVPSTVIGFPHGGTTTAAKVAETQWACDDGAREVDMVINLGAALAEDWKVVAADISAVVAEAKRHDVITKVILETGLLPNDETKRELCRISEAEGAAFVKTSTGFGFKKAADGSLQATGATEHDIALMRATCSDAVQVKASGGIRSYDDAKRLFDLGATRLGTSGTEAIASGEASTTDY